MSSMLRVNGQCARCLSNSLEWMIPSFMQYHPRSFSTSASIRKRQQPSKGLRITRFPSDSRLGIIEPVVNNTGGSGSPLNFAYRKFTALILEEFDALLKEDLPLENWGLKADTNLEEQSKGLRNRLRHIHELSFQDGADGILNRDELFTSLKNAMKESHLRGMRAELRFKLMSELVGTRFAKTESIAHKKLSDLRHPIEWYPATRAIQREVHLHVGPTNSGKTYHALKRLESAASGVYAGPLRLLAHEVYTRLNAAGKNCALITGEERRLPENKDEKLMLRSCTVEMVPLNTLVDVAVIDEIQMLGDTCRGWAWTQAFLGLQAKELHLCGELRTIPLIEDLCALMGDKLIIHRYDRLSPLKTASKSLNGDLKKLQKGDCVILFSRVAIHAMKNKIEKATGKRCAVVYGSLPPETRAQQAALFNDPNNDYDFLAASDAIGMGLNLSIKRVIFESVVKMRNNGTRGSLSISDVKQIGGRAGRFKTASQAVTDATNVIKNDSPAEMAPEEDPTTGIVTTLDPYGLRHVRECMDRDADPLMSAGILPPDDVLIRFASYFPKETPFSYILLRLHEISRISSRFHLCSLRDQIGIADLIQPYDLSIRDRICFLSGPANLRDLGMPQVLQAFAKAIAERSGGELLKISQVNLELLDKSKADFVSGTKAFLQELEGLHKALTLYLWLSYRFESIFTSQALCFHVKSVVEEKIDQCLEEVAWQKILQDNARKELKANSKKNPGEDGAEKNKKNKSESASPLQTIIPELQILGSNQEILSTRIS